MPSVKSPRKTRNKEQGVRVSALVVMDAQVLDKARDKARQHGIPFSNYLERACRVYGKYLDHKITVIARPL
jgi:hypothetical protein